MFILRCLLVIVLLVLLSPVGVATVSAQLEASQWSGIPHGKARFFKRQNQAQVQWGLEIRLESEWHTYWHNPGDSGAQPNMFALSGQQEMPLAIYYPYPSRMDVGPLTTYGYADHTVYFFDLLAAHKALRADLLVCKEECIPGSIEASLSQFDSLAPKDAQALEDFIEQQKLRLPQSKPIFASVTPGTLASRWRFNLPNDARLVDIFWFAGQVNNLHKPDLVFAGSGQYNFHRPLEFATVAEPRALLVYQLGNNTVSTEVRFEKKPPQILPFILMAMLGGLILNLMPCVFPIVSLKAFAIASAAGKGLAQVRRDQLYYCFGVVSSFVVMALFIASIRATGQYIGWGFQLQNPWIVASLASLFLVLGLSFFDIWTVNRIPGFASLFSMSQGSGPLASFFTGLLAVVVASPCTAPFMGAAIGFALSQSSVIIFAVFAGLGLGMSAPFLLLALFPTLSRYLPKPGHWMVVFKKVMGVFLILTSVWLAWVGWQLITVSKVKSDSQWQSLSVSEWDSIKSMRSARFINFTADWCVSCKVNERVVFANDEVKDYFEKYNVHLFKVDWTKRETAIGEKLAEFGRAGVPLYLFFPEGSDAPIVLPELLTPDMLMSRLTELNPQSINQ